ncbi:MAG TPA: 3-dehydroquinate synthase [Acidimicrobiia bacterium]|nr:3-dehydroquinate synthase [Acidimicrobiia bacterium]
MRRITVPVDPPYDVVVGPGALREIATVLRDRPRVGIVSQRTLVEYSDLVESVLGEAGARPILVTIADGETAKSLQSVEFICDELSTAGLLRGDALVALGGGVVGDAGGFAAAIYHRGIDIVQAPTTLLAQVDAAIGGKTAANLPAGKNLVGAFHQPIAVLADVDTLRTLPDREYRAGLGEVAKYAFLPEGGRLAKLLADEVEQLCTRNASVVTELIAECASIKAVYIAADPQERTGKRAVLNYGHTLAHALEAVSGYDLLHGEAVAIGLVFADALALRRGLLSPAECAEHRAVLENIGLPTAVGMGRISRAVCIDQMHRDKKAKGGLTFVLPGPDGFSPVDIDPAAPELARAFESVGVEG